MTDQDRQLIERINALSATARTSWLALLAFLAYIGITLLAVQDADFFVPSRQTQLPLVGISIPTFSFFIFAPLLAAALYIYLQIHLVKLWDALATAPSRIDGDARGDRIHPWIANDLFLTLREKYRRDGAASARPLRRLSNLASRAMVWAFAPLVLAGFWWRSMPAHDEWLTLWLALCLLVATYAGLSNWWSVRTAARRPHRRPWPKPWAGWWSRLVGVVMATFIVAVSWLRTEYDLTIDTETPIAGPWLGSRSFSTLVPANLVTTEMVPLPADWRSIETARWNFRETWCRREGLEMEVCDHFADVARPPPPGLSSVRLNSWCQDRDLKDRDACDAHFVELDQRFAEAWEEERISAVAKLANLDLEDQDLRRARAPGVSLVGANLGRARLQGAILWGAQLEGANLDGAWLDGADLTDAGLEGASMFSTQLVGANLRGARMVGASLLAARMEGASFRGASLHGTFLAGADLRDADWTQVSSLVAFAPSADFRAGKALMQATLDSVVGNEATLLPDMLAPDTGVPFNVWSCWSSRPKGSEVLGGRVRGDFRQGIQSLASCPQGDVPQKTGTPCSLDLTREQCLDPAQNPHHPANRPR